MPLLESPDTPRIERHLKAASRQRFTETSGIKIRAFLADAELFLTLCSRPRDRWGFFVLAWLGSEEAEKVRRSHVADTVALYEKFRDGLIGLFGRFEFEGAYRATLRGLLQSGSESVAAHAARTTDLCSHAYAEVSTEAQFLLAVDHFIAGLADSSLREYLQRERAQRKLEWLETVRIAQASEASRISNFEPTAAAASAAHDSRSLSTSFASRDQSNSVNSSIRNRESQWSSRSSNTRSKQPANSNSSKQLAQSLSRDNLNTPDRSTPHDPPRYSSPTDGMAASQSSQSNRPSSKPNSTVCFKCGNTGQIAWTCTTEGKPPRRCYACSGFKHLSRNCLSRSRQQPVQRAESKPKSSNAVLFAGTGAPQLFSEAVIDGVQIRDVLFDTGSAFSILSCALYDSLPWRPSINSFKNSAPDIIGVGGASAKVRGYIDVPLQIAGIEVAHALLVVSNLSFSLLIGMDVLQSHAAKMSLGSAAPLELSARVCDVCFEQRTNPSSSYRSSPTVACRRIHYCCSEIGESRDCSFAARSAGRFYRRNRAAQLDCRDPRVCRSACSLRSSCRCLPRRCDKQFR